MWLCVFLKTNIIDICTVHIIKFENLMCIESTLLREIFYHRVKLSRYRPGQALGLPGG